MSLDQHLTEIVLQHYKMSSINFISKNTAGVAVIEII